MLKPCARCLFKQRRRALARCWCWGCDALLRVTEVVVGTDIVYKLFASRIEFDKSLFFCSAHSEIGFDQRERSHRWIYLSSRELCCTNVFIGPQASRMTRKCLHKLRTYRHRHQELPGAQESDVLSKLTNAVPHRMKSFQAKLATQS